MQILVAGERHLEELATLRVDLLAETGGEPDKTVRSALVESNYEFFRANLDSPLWQSWVVEIDERVVSIGTLAFFDRPPYVGNPEGKEAYLLNMYTQPAYRGRGAASAIVDAALSEARRRGVRKLIVHATAAGRPLYAKVGFLAATAYMELTAVA
jgi:GNAT superfamily N-acetyltransferase